jgi:hypothetical protein
VYPEVVALAFIMANQEFQEFTISLPGGKTKSFRKWKNPKTSKQRKDNEAYERTLRAHQRNTGQESVEGVHPVALSIRSAYEQAAKMIQDDSNLDEEEKRQRLKALHEEKVGALNRHAPERDSG